METGQTSFTRLIECYFETWFLFAHTLLAGPARDKVMKQQAMPRQLRVAYCLLQLPAEVSLTDVHTQYRRLAKRYHPDAGGDHSDFLALQQAYERVVEYLQPLR